MNQVMSKFHGTNGKSGRRRGAEMVPKPKSRSFATCYMELCKQQRIRPLPLICVTLPYILDFSTDRVKIDEWPPILKSLQTDKCLKCVTVRSRYQLRKPLEEINAEDQARAMKKAPAVLTRHILEWLSHSVAQNLKNSSSLTRLELEGIPLPPDCLAMLCVGLANTQTLQHLSLQRCYIGDKSCEMVCRTVAAVHSIKSLNLGQCDLTAHCGPFLSAALSKQQLSLFHDTWMQSLRYREPNLEAMSGLRRLTLNGNPRLSDSAVSVIIEAITDSLWLKALDLQHCGLTDAIGGELLQLLDYNRTLLVVDVRMNPALNEDTVREVIMRTKRNNPGGSSEFHWISMDRESHQKTIIQRRNSCQEIMRKREPRLTVSSSMIQVKQQQQQQQQQHHINARRARNNAPNNTKRSTTSIAQPGESQAAAGDAAQQGGGGGKAEVTRQALRLNLQAQINQSKDTTNGSLCDGGESVSQEANDTKDSSQLMDPLIARMEIMNGELSHIRTERDRLVEEIKRSNLMLMDERQRREALEAKLQATRRNLSDFEEVVREKDRQSQGYLMVSPQSLNEISSSFERLLGMLDSAVASSNSNRHSKFDDLTEEDEGVEDLKRRVTLLIRKTRSEGLRKGFPCSEVESKHAATARKMAKSECDVRVNGLTSSAKQPKVPPPIHVERNIGDNPDTVSTPINVAGYRNAYDKFRDNNDALGARARAIFAQIINNPESLIELRNSQY